MGCDRAVCVLCACSGRAVHMEAATEWGGWARRACSRASSFSSSCASSCESEGGGEAWLGRRMRGGREGWAARPLLLVLSEPALGSPLIQDLLARCTARQDLLAPVGLPLLAPRAHRHAEELLRVGVAEQPRLAAAGAHAVVLVGLDALPRRAGPGVRRLAGGARRRARVVVQRAGGHRHGLRRAQLRAFEIGGRHPRYMC
eukprot:scaffold74313_cov51-Phaeocystis_antarctica.AAC.2